VSELEREARIQWLAHPPQGVPRITVGSKAFTALPLSLVPEGVHPLAASPGELYAGVVGGVTVLFVAERLAGEGTQAQELEITVTLSVSEGETEDMHVTGLRCRLLGRVPGTTAERFAQVGTDAAAQCVQALGLRENLPVAMSSALLGA
jgi:organic hydroperoxide reductase OsmC/OhrA